MDFECLDIFAFALEIDDIYSSLDLVFFWNFVPCENRSGILIDFYVL